MREREGRECAPRERERENLRRAREREKGACEREFASGDKAFASGDGRENLHERENAHEIMRTRDRM